MGGTGARGEGRRAQRVRDTADPGTEGRRPRSRGRAGLVGSKPAIQGWSREEAPEGHTRPSGFI